MPSAIQTALEQNWSCGLSLSIIQMRQFFSVNSSFTPQIRKLIAHSSYVHVYSGRGKIRPSLKPVVHLEVIEIRYFEKHDIMTMLPSEKKRNLRIR